jgi:organic radical activating enzyme
MEHLNDYQLRRELGDNYWDDLCPDPARYLNPKDLLDFDALIEWIEIFRPAARNIHLSGGEPLLRPDIEIQTKKLTDRGYSVSIFTNGQLISQRPGLLALPLKWAVTYHQPSGISVRDFLTQLSYLQGRPVVVHTVVQTYKQTQALPSLREAFRAYKFVVKIDHDTDNSFPNFIPYSEDLDDIASNRISLVIPTGAVFPCNSARAGAVGNIYEPSFDAQAARAMDAVARACVERNECAAYHSACLMDSL